MSLTKCVTITGILTTMFLYFPGYSQDVEKGESVKIHEQEQSMDNTHHNSQTGETEKVDIKTGMQKTCPVMGNSINKDVYVDYYDKRVYFCCGMCTKEFLKTPEKYLKKLDELGEVPESL